MEKAQKCETVLNPLRLQQKKNVNYHQEIGCLV